MNLMVKCYRIFNNKTICSGIIGKIIIIGNTFNMCPALHKGNSILK